MKLKIKLLHLSTGGELLAIVNERDATSFDIHSMDRIKIVKGKKLETVVVNTAKGQTTVPNGYIGISDEVNKSLKLRNNETVKVIPARKPLSLNFIRKKLDGIKLNKEEMDQIVWDIVHNKLSPVELAYFVAACYTNVLTIEETIYLLKSMVRYGDVLKLNRHPIVDKHCIGGVPNNRTTLILVPIIAAAGYTIPKTSSRSITSPAGTADAMEVLANVSFTIKKMKKIVLKTNGCIVWGGSLNLAPADDKLIKVERPLEIDAESQLLASIMAKKYSVASTHILIDIPVGTDAKVKNKVEATSMKKKFEEIGKKLRKKIKVIFTDGEQPIGNGIGPALEVRDALYILRRDPRRPKDLEQKCLIMAAHIFGMLGVKNGYNKALDLLESGKAYKKFVEIIRAQGGKEIPPEDIKIGKLSFDVASKKSGMVKDIDNILISRIARIAGAPQEKAAGIYIYKHIGDKVKKGEKLYTIYSGNKEKLDFAKTFAKDNHVFIL